MQRPARPCQIFQLKRRFSVKKLHSLCKASEHLLPLGPATHASHPSAVWQSFASSWKPDPINASARGANCSQVAIGWHFPGWHVHLHLSGQPGGRVSISWAGTKVVSQAHPVGSLLSDGSFKSCVVWKAVKAYGGCWGRTGGSHSPHYFWELWCVQRPQQSMAPGSLCPQVRLLYLKT